ncbi:hypothetical protein NIES4072_35350 [Nostoc commune NIES-4072]|uniref:Uncharacterized protein n=1 Tax=Nostoc commune NIES-4072 TaxID=2005467 RepID=A0A2R5FM65_NOSCO|nr:hypothetical protein [Nostoc commune]BBD69136.1 hypothetical protein NIES4070_55440 [Nostoc commune HK-02]GBG19866.1 hypothetical protein NIES4072_35350 [Nostoc commune NIES-4072]
MVTLNKTLEPLEAQEPTHFHRIEKTYQNNKDSDYTEKLKELGNEFNYAKNSNYYWSKPDLSLLYGTPLYDAASETQKLALNHLYWVGNYNHTAVSEASTSIYNMVTSGVFRAVGGYETLCDELDFETEQESYHIRTFQKIGYKSKMAIVGKTILGNSLYGKTAKDNSSWLNLLIPQPVREYFTSNQGSSPFSIQRDNTLSAIAKTMLSDKKQYYSQYLRNLEEKGEPIPAPADGLAGRIAPRHWLRFFTVHWGMSPFMACQYYSLRYTANAILKNQEYPYVRYYRELEQKGEYIPAPTAVSYYHLLDEAFHTTISQTIARDMYKDFPKPTAYEKFISGSIVYQIQRNLLSGLSGVLPGRCVYDDQMLMLFYYKLLKSPLFDMETKEALDWMEKCFCQEHEGFQTGLKYHQSLLELMRRLFNRLDYQWSVNRNMGIMAAGASIDKAIQNNIPVFKEFKKSVIAQDT